MKAIGEFEGAGVAGVNQRDQVFGEGREGLMDR